MANDYRIQMQGFDEVQAAMLKAIEAVQPSGALGEAVKESLFMVQAYLRQVTHVETGTYTRSHVIQYDGGESGIVTPSPYNINPKSHLPPSVYAIYEEARGGEHAAYATTVRNRGQAILNKAGVRITKELH